MTAYVFLSLLNGVLLGLAAWFATWAFMDWWQS